MSTFGRELIAGTIAGITSTAFGHPLDTVKVCIFYNIFSWECKFQLKSYQWNNAFIMCIKMKELKVFIKDFAHQFSEMHQSMHCNFISLII